MKKQIDYGNKPYNRCLSCPHRKVRCDGPRTSAMDLRRWCEFMHDMKEINGLTNAYIAEKSGVSIKTIEKLMAQTYGQDIMRDNARRIEDVIIGSSNQYPCILAFEESLPENNQKLATALTELERAQNDINEYKAAFAKIHDSHNTEMQFLRDEAKLKIDHLLAEVDQLRKENANLWAEVNHKTKIIDMVLEKQEKILSEKERG